MIWLILDHFETGLSCVIHPLFLANHDPIPAFRFLGHGFVGRDFIAGQDGALQYQSNVGDIPFGEDGAYCVLRTNVAGTTEIGTDYKGYFHLYTYQSGANLAIGSSFAPLAEYARAQAWPITPNLGSLISWTANPDLIRTVMTFDTSVREINLLPSRNFIRITQGKLSTHPLEIQGQDCNYRNLLRDALHISRDRVATLMAAETLDLSSHITGGLDSRVVFSMLSGRPYANTLKSADPIKFHSQTNRELDFSVATNVANARGITLNPTTNTSEQSAPLTGEQAYTQWRDAHLGSYAHILFPGTQRRNAKAVLPGLAGETLRHVYTPKLLTAPIEKIVSIQKKRFDDPEQFESWSQGLIKADASLKIAPDSHFSAMVRNHREFRDRFHTGHSMFWQIVVPPFAAKAFILASNALTAQPFLRNKLLYDILNSCGPDLIALPFDKPEKSVPPDLLKKLIFIKNQPAATAGKAYVSAQEPDTASASSAAEHPLKILADAVSDAAASPAVRDLLGKDTVTTAQANITQALQTGARNLHGRGRPAHALCLAKLVLG